MKTYTTYKTTTEYFDSDNKFKNRITSEGKLEEFVFCDICKRKGRDGRSGNCYEVDETEVTVSIKAEKGHSYPEGGSKTIYDFDICPKCFQEHLIPFLESKGCIMNEKEVDW